MYHFSLDVLVAITSCLAAAAASAQAPPAVRVSPVADADGIAALAARALDARALGQQAVLLARGYELRAAAPTEPIGHLVLAFGHGSLGPRFAREVAEQAFGKVLQTLAAPLPADAVQRVLAFAGVRPRDGIDGLRARVHAWLQELGLGEPLLLAPDHAALVRLVDRLGRRVDSVASRLAGERARLERLRQEKRRAERALERERTRARNASSGLVDLQPYVDAIASRQRGIRSSESRRREYEAELAALRTRADRARSRLAQLR